MINMPIPFIVGGIAIAAGLTGAAAGVNGAMKISEAKDQIEKAERRYNKAKSEFDDAESATQESLATFGENKATVGKSFEQFSNVFEKIRNRPEFKEYSNDLVDMPKYSLADIKKVQVTSIEILGTAAAGAGAGAFAGFAAYGGVMALGTASTGTAITALSGVAATNATLAALGGGSLAAGGGGMALGSTILAGAVAGPVIAVGGLLANAKGNDSLEKARQVENEVEGALTQINKGNKVLKKLNGAVNKMSDALERLYVVYAEYLRSLTEIVDVKQDYKTFSTEEKNVLNTTILLVKTLNNIIVTELVKPAEEGEFPLVRVVAVNKAYDNAEIVLDPLEG